MLTVFNQELAQQLVNSAEQFPVNFDLAWQWIEYSKKSNAKRFLIENFEEEIDFLINEQPTTIGIQAHPEQRILLTIDCLKSWGMMAGTAKGKEIRKYFLNCERIAKTKTPQTYIEALKALIKAEEEKELLKLENEQLETDNETLATAVDELFDYSSILRVAKFNDLCESNFKWRHLKNVAIKLGLEIKNVPSPRYANGQNLYPHDAWRVAYPDVALPETTTLRVYRHN
jgi:phage anti-repressor protein